MINGRLIDATGQTVSAACISAYGKDRPIASNVVVMYAGPSVSQRRWNSGTRRTASSTHLRSMTGASLRTSEQFRSNTLPSGDGYSKCTFGSDAGAAQDSHNVVTKSTIRSPSMMIRVSYSSHAVAVKKTKWRQSFDHRPFPQ